MPLCTPAHRWQMKIPMLYDAHSGSTEQHHSIVEQQNNLGVQVKKTYQSLRILINNSVSPL